MESSKTTPKKKRMNKSVKNCHMMTDADGTRIKVGDTVALLDSNGIEEVNMETLEDCTGVINKISHKIATVDGIEHKSDEIRRVVMK